MRLARAAVQLAALGTALALWPAGAAHAFERELQLGVAPAYAYEAAAEDSVHGYGAALHIRYGITDYIGVALQAAWAGHPLSSPPPGSDPLRQVVTAVAGVVYAFDVMRIVPYMAILVGASIGLEADEPEASFLAQIDGGFDFLLTRDVSVGLDVAYQLQVGAEVSPARILGTLRVSWHRLL